MIFRLPIIVLAAALVLSLGQARADEGKARVFKPPRSEDVGVETTAQTYKPPRPDRGSATVNHSTPRGGEISNPQPVVGMPGRCAVLGPRGVAVVAAVSPDCLPAAPAPAASAAPAAPAPSPEQIARSIIDRSLALAPDPQLRLVPARVGLTGLDSFFWLASEPRPITATAGVGGFTVTAEADPAQYVWDFGDGSEKTTSHPGRRWTRRRPGNIGYLYETRGTYEVNVEVIWRARWRVGPGAWQPLGFFTTSDSVAYPVRQVISFLVRPR